MPGGGIYGFVTYGSQNILLSANPDMSYFYKVYRKYTHFAEESFTLPFDGPNELKWDQPIQIRVKFSRYADLMREAYFVFTLPDIYSKFVAERDPYQYEFAWSRYIGCRIIQNCAVYIGGQKIQEFDGAYIAAKAALDLDNTQLENWRHLVGDVPDLYDPANGEFSGGLSNSVVQGSYPTVYPDPTLVGVAQTNRPSIFGRDIYVPLPFWFTQDSTLALPLCALQQQEVELQILLRPLKDLYTIKDVSGYTVAPGYYMSSTYSDFLRNVPTYTETAATDLNNYYINNFLVDINYTPPTKNEININPRLYANYVYLTDEERAVFVSTELKYIITQATRYTYPSEYKRNYLQLDIHNPITRLVVAPRRSDAIYRNDGFNFTNWLDGKAPFISTPTPPPPPPPAPPAPPTPASSYKTSGLLLPQGQRDIIRNMKILCDGNEIQDDRPAFYFTHVVPYKYYNGTNSLHLAPYPFSIKQSAVQPAGSINASRIRNFQIDFDPWPLPSPTTYVYDVTVYVESINWVVIASGMGGLKYAV
jgi:hypothetical protein